MKKLAIFILALSMSVLSVAQVRWLEAECNFGLVEEAGGRVACVFRMVNEGSEATAIIDVKSSCGCVGAEYPVEAIAPGDTAAVRVVFNPEKMAGGFKKRASVKLIGERSELSVYGVVKPTDATVDFRFPGDYGIIRLQRSWIHIEDVKAGELKCEAFSAYNNSADTLEIEVVKSPEYLDVKIESDAVRPYEMFSFICYVDPSKVSATGVVEDKIVLSVSGQIIEIPFSAYIY